MDPILITLRDGTEMITRPMVPGDRAGLAEAYRRASPESRYNRFWTWTGEMVGERMLSRILEQDPARHISWAVLDPSRDFPPVGGASWWRTAARPDEAEISAIVLDEDHGRGIGTMLLALMCLTARQAGVRELVGYALPENDKAAEWMRGCGAESSWDGYKLIFRWNLEDMPALLGVGGSLARWLGILSRLPQFTEGS